jgi:nucleotide-binding universal stress UspA family protein
MAFARILIAVDDQPIAEHAAKVAIELARALTAEIAVITVVDTSLDRADSGGMVDELAVEAAQEAGRLLADFVQRLSLPSSTPQFVERGVPSAEIVRVATEWGADLVVVGSHGRGRIGRALVGSVADGVLRHAPCPVLAVRAKA